MMPMIAVNGDKRAGIDKGLATPISVSFFIASMKNVNAR